MTVKRPPDPLIEYVNRRRMIGVDELPPDPQELLLLSIAIDTREMLILAQSNQQFINQTMQDISDDRDDTN